MDYFIIVLLVLLSGMFSGLTLGLLSIKKNDLERKIKLGDRRAKKIYSIRKNGNFLLCVLLIGNVAVNAAISIYLSNLASGFIAGVIATSLIVLFGEIIPQSFCAKYGFLIGYRLVWLVKIFSFILYPLAAPLAWVLNKILGEEIPTIWSKEELKEIIKTHEDSSCSDIDADEERILIGALSFSNKRVRDVMTPRDVVHAYGEHQVLNNTILKEIKKSGFSRIPVYAKRVDNIIGILFVKNLIDIEKNIKISRVVKRDKIIKVSPNKKIDSLLNLFAKEKKHLAVVFERSKFVGVITLEDIVEEVFRIEIVDETDTHEDLRVFAKKNNLVKKYAPTNY
ncbi:MAG: DUF21 domain-containing protein [Candidatus Moranbacteria bacterium]|nr:DUF21 domain-containing protein [Candidatus Moranbacteria bacterium]